MGIDSRLFISHRWTVEDVRDVIALRFGVKPQYQPTEFPNYCRLIFQPKGSNETRMMHVHFQSSVGGIPAIQVGFRHNKSGVKILETLAETFGGILQEQDNEEEYKVIDLEAEGNLDFIVKEALKSDPKLGTDSSKMAEYLARDGWKENTKKIYGTQE